MPLLEKMMRCLEIMMMIIITCHILISKILEITNQLNLGNGECHLIIGLIGAFIQVGMKKNFRDLEEQEDL